MKVISHVGKGKKVLDVGCASGYLDEYFKKNGCMVVGIEMDAKAAAFARKYCENVLVMDIEETVELPYPDDFFDVILYADVLEHLKRPDLALMRIKRYLSPSGYLIASIPNIGYVPVRMKLLLGKFEYEEYGHLDKTHLRFFTLKTCKKLFQESGFYIEKIDYSGPASIVKVAPTLLAMEFIIISKKKI